MFILKDITNPRTKNYSKLKLFLIFLEKLILNFFNIFFIILNYIKPARHANSVLDFGEFKDTRYINFLFYSLKKNFIFSYNYDLKVFILIKKIGIKNFLLFCSPNSRVKKKNEKLVILFNKENCVYLQNKKINFNTNYFKSIYDRQTIFQNKIYMPYYLYPRIYNYKYEKLNSFYKKKKIFHIIFSGSVHPLLYSKFNWRHKSGLKMLTRTEILKFIIKEFASEIFFLEHKKDLKNNHILSKKIILCMNEKLEKKSRLALSNMEHLDFVASSNFFLTAPGTGMPLCHHLIESIKFGTIPITSYPDLMYPSMPFETCLSFENYNDLYNSIKAALAMNKNEIIEKQINLIRFYNKNLSPDSFCKKFIKLKSSSNLDIDIISCNDHESVERFCKKS